MATYGGGKAWKPDPITSRGPRSLGLSKRPERREGPGKPPPGFLTQQTTEDEWYIYWALAKIFSDPGPITVRQAPFAGGLDWEYQAVKSSLGLTGKTAIDFLIFLPGELVGLRIQTERYHVLVDEEKSAYDVSQFLALSRSITMHDLYSQDFIEDASGESAVRVTIEALGGRDRLPAAARARRTHIGVR